MQKNRLSFLNSPKVSRKATAPCSFRHFLHLLVFPHRCTSTPIEIYPSAITRSLARKKTLKTKQTSGGFASAYIDFHRATPFKINFNRPPRSIDQLRVYARCVARQSMNRKTSEKRKQAFLHTNILSKERNGRRKKSIGNSARQQKAFPQRQWNLIFSQMRSRSPPYGQVATIFMHFFASACCRLSFTSCFLLLLLRIESALLSSSIMCHSSRESFIGNACYSFRDVPLVYVV